MRNSLVYAGVCFLCSAALLQPQWAPSFRGKPIVVAPHEIALMGWGPSSPDVDTLREMHLAGLNVSGFCHV